MNSEQHLRVLLGGVRIEGGHDASLPETDNPDDGAAELELAMLPGPLGESGDAANEQIRPKPPAIVAEESDRAVGGDEQRKHVEPIQAVIAHEPRPRSGGLPDVRRTPAIAPRPPVDERLTVGSQRSL